MSDIMCALVGALLVIFGYCAVMLTLDVISARRLTKTIMEYNPAKWREDVDRAIREYQPTDIEDGDSE